MFLQTKYIKITGSKPTYSAINWDSSGLRANDLIPIDQHDLLVFGRPVHPLDLKPELLEKVVEESPADGDPQFAVRHAVISRDDSLLIFVEARIRYDAFERLK
ncbi:MAG: hypothetical protein QF449_04250, partial [Alphaproteobacteria bacterium]|jgi:hypothetical protein|nr:hypothetical protein [Alphaproteobacteria bacterium]